MTIDEQRSFPARLASLGDATAFVEQFGASNLIARDDLLRLTLIVEELFTNTIVHGHRGDSEATIGIGLGATPEVLLLQFEDSAPPFDPLQWLDASAPDLDAGPAERPIGGLGVHLVVRLAQRVDHAHVGGVNRLRLWLERRG